MSKPMALALLLLLPACQQDPGVRIASGACWQEVREGVRVHGTATLLYFPDTATLLVNQGCPKNVLHASLNETASAKLAEIMQKVEDPDTVIDVAVPVEISGVTYRIPKVDGMFIRVDKLEPERGHAPKIARFRK